MKKIKAFTLAEVLMAKRMRGKECLHSISRVSEPKEPSKNINKLTAFTLAEVLITLAIIGVVAALTIPTVVTNYKAKALETQKKKAMSVLANGFKLLMANDDVASFRDTKLAACGTEKACIANEVKRVFNIISDNMSSNDAFNTKYQFESGLKEFWTNFDSAYVFVTSDGMIFGITDTSEDGVKMAADVNGIKNPNKGGEDLCSFSLRNNNMYELCSRSTDFCTVQEESVCGRCNPNACENEEECEAAGGTWGDCVAFGPTIHVCYCRFHN